MTQNVNATLLVSRAMEAFQNRLNAQDRRRAPGELRPSQVHRVYPHHSNRQRERYLRQEAARAAKLAAKAA